MPADYDLKPVLTFLAGLKRNTNKPWFEAHRAEFDAARAEFEAFVAYLLAAIGKFEDFGHTTAPDCIFRINRDVRFSPDKTPYKTHFGAYLAPGGRKSLKGGYYLQLMLGGSMLAGGMHSPSPAALSAFRDRIATDPAPFLRIVENRAFRQQFGEIHGERLKSAPQGVARDHPQIEWLRLKQLIAEHDFTDAEVLAPGFDRELVKLAKVMHPFSHYMAAFESGHSGE
ncbi:MAG: DUF2461 domain-containing protein [Chloroflexi bacterium]|nr:DUF2461 domain-containing protein [Chloroflexota bacterium]